MRNLNLFVCSISLWISDAVGNKTLFAIFLRGRTGMNSADNNSWTSEHTSVFHNGNQAAAKQTHFTSWLAGEPKQAMCLVAEVCPSSQPCLFIRISQKTQFAAAHGMELHSSMWWDDDTSTTAITLHVWGTVQMCSCRSLGVDRSDSLTFNPN